jgi:hypothetical protein
MGYKTELRKTVFIIIIIIIIDMLMFWAVKISRVKDEEISTSILFLIQDYPVSKLCSSPL